MEIVVRIILHIVILFYLTLFIDGFSTNDCILNYCSQKKDFKLNIMRRNAGRKSIQGRGLVICRDFKIDSMKKFEFIGSYRDCRLIPRFTLPEIAFIGRSNVGKSSLINCLTNLKKGIAVTSKTPGRTQTLNLIQCSEQNGGEICLFADLPGYGYAKMAKEDQAEVSQFVNQYLRNRGALELCIVLLDARREPLESDYQTLKVGNTLLSHSFTKYFPQNLDEEGIPHAIVLTKVDLINKTELEKITQKIRKLYHLDHRQPIPFSATKGIGKRELWKFVHDFLLEELEPAEQQKKAKQAIPLQGNSSNKSDIQGDEDDDDDGSDDEFGGRMQDPNKIIREYLKHDPDPFKEFREI